MERLSWIVRTKHPLQLNVDFALWPLAIIREWVRQEFDASLGEVLLAG